MRRKGLWLVLLVAVVIAFAGWVWWSVKRDDRANSRTLADGSVVRLKEVGFGRQLRIRTGNRWQDHLGMALPEAWADKFGAGQVLFGGSNKLNIWLERKNFSKLQPDLRGVMFDSHGCEFGFYGPSTSLGGEILAFEFPEYPRREKTMGLRLYQAGMN